MKTLVSILMLFFPVIAFAQQVIKFKTGIGYNVNIISHSKDTVRYQMMADSSVTLAVSMGQVESISPAIQYWNQQPTGHQKYIFKIDDGIDKPYKARLISVNDSLIYYQEHHESGQKHNIYLWYTKINEILVYRKNHIGPYVGLAAGFIGGFVYTVSTQYTSYYSSFSLFGTPEQKSKTTYPNWWTMFAGAAIGTAIGILIESVVKKKIKMKINHNRDEYLKYKPMLEKYLNHVN